MMKTPNQPQQEANWTRWLLQTARTWKDIAGIITETGIGPVDEDHRKLTDYALELNRLIDLQQQEDFSLEYVQRLGILLQRLYDYTEEHFSKEEQLLANFQLVGRERHKQKHDEILSSLRRFLEDFKQGRLALSMRLKLSVLDWLVTHINQEDAAIFLERDWKTELVLKARSWEDLAPIIQKVGVEKLDWQHQQMIVQTLKLVNQLADEDLLIDDNTATRLFQDYNALIEGVEEHFQDEQTMMKDFGLKGYQEHADAHQAFLLELSLSEDDLIAGGPELANQIKTNILKWWIDHINGADYKIFGTTDWALDLMERAQAWEDVQNLIKQMGIPIIDEQHKTMTQLTLDLNQLISRLEMGESGPEIHALVLKGFEAIHSFALLHFKTEEDLIKSRGLDNALQQNENHAQFLGMIQGYAKDFRHQRINATKKIQADILAWWINHINVLDYSTFRIDNWEARIMSRAKSWEEVKDLVQQMKIEILDQQHQRLTEQILSLNSVTEALQEKGNQPELVGQAQGIIRQILDLAQEHFATEEGIIKKRGGKNLEQQSQSHLVFIEMLQSFLANYQTGRLAQNKQLKLDLLAWWIGHINKLDFETFREDQEELRRLATATSLEGVQEMVKSIQQPALDQEHEQMSRLIMQLSHWQDSFTHQGEEREKAMNATQELFGHLGRVASLHFAHEEAAIAEQKLPNLALQREQHQYFLGLLAFAENNFSQDRILLNSKLQGELLGWWFQHISVLDFQTFVEKKDLSAASLVAPR